MTLFFVPFVSEKNTQIFAALRAAQTLLQVTTLCDFLFHFFFVVVCSICCCVSEYAFYSWLTVRLNRTRSYSRVSLVCDIVRLVTLLVSARSILVG